MTIPMEKAVLALKLLVESASIRAIERTVELHRDTICRLLVLSCEKCEKILGRLIVNIQGTSNATKSGALSERKRRWSVLMTIPI